VPHLPQSASSLLSPVAIHPLAQTLQAKAAGSSPFGQAIRTRTFLQRFHNGERLWAAQLPKLRWLPQIVAVDHVLCAQAGPNEGAGHSCSGASPSDGPCSDLSGQRSPCTAAPQWGI